MTRGRLSQAESQRIFAEDILPTYLPNNLQRLDQPTAVLLGGQPGSGKTLLLTMAESAMRTEGSTIRIVGDDLRAYVPGYARHQRQDPEAAARATGPDAGRWVEMLIAAARDRRVNVIVEGTMREPETVRRTAETFRSAGYRVEAWALAVNERISWAGVHTRFEAMIAAGGTGRMTPRDMHDAAAAGMLTTLREIERNKIVDRVHVLDRGGAALYDNTLENGVWLKEPAAASRVENARGRPLPASELQDVIAGWNDVLRLMAARGAPAPAIEAVRSVADDDRAYFEAQRRPLIPADIVDEASFLADARGHALQQPLYLRERAAIGQLLNRMVRNPARAVADIEGALGLSKEEFRDRVKSLAASPDAMGGLRGGAGSWIRAKDADRERAEIAAGRFVPMALAVKDIYDHCFEVARSALQERSERNLIEIPALSDAATAALLEYHRTRNSRQDALGRLGEDPTIASEVRGFAIAVEGRFGSRPDIADRLANQVVPHDGVINQVGDLVRAAAAFSEQRSGQRAQLAEEPSRSRGPTLAR